MADLIPNPEFDRMARPALTSYRDALPGGFLPPALGDIRARAHRRAVLRGASLTAVTAACVLVAAGIAVATWPDRDGVPPAPGDSASPTAAPSPAPVTSPPAVTSAPPAWPKTLAGETVVVPPVPAAGYVQCPAGRVTFAANGKAVLDGRQIFTSALLATGDLTGDGQPEAVVYVGCGLTGGNDSGDGSGHLLVITRDSGGTFTGLAHVGPDGENYPAAKVRDGELTATIDQRYGPAVQERTYRWDGRAFVQIAGLTAFPA